MADLMSTIRKVIEDSSPASWLQVFRVQRYDPESKNTKPAGIAVFR